MPATGTFAPARRSFRYSAARLTTIHPTSYCTAALATCGIEVPAGSTTMTLGRSSAGIWSSASNCFVWVMASPPA